LPINPNAKQHSIIRKQITFYEFPHGLIGLLIFSCSHQKSVYFWIVQPLDMPHMHIIKF